MKVRYLASSPPVTAPPETPIREIAAIMASRRIGLVVLVKGDELAGVVSERDVVRAVAQGLDLGLPVEAIATKNVVTIEANADVKEAAALFYKHNIRHLVVTDKGRLYGVLSIRDLLREKEILVDTASYADLQAENSSAVGD